jgi:hypothetical protein
MDTFTLAVVIGMGVVICIFLGLTLVDKGAPDTETLPKVRKKKSS